MSTATSPRWQTAWTLLCEARSVSYIALARLFFLGQTALHFIPMEVSVRLTLRTQIGLYHASAVAILIALAGFALVVFEGGSLAWTLIPLFLGCLGLRVLEVHACARFRAWYEARIPGGSLLEAWAKRDAQAPDLRLGWADCGRLFGHTLWVVGSALSMLLFLSAAWTPVAWWPPLMAALLFGGLGEWVTRSPSPAFEAWREHRRLCLHR